MISSTLISLMSAFFVGMAVGWVCGVKRVYAQQFVCSRAAHSQIYNELCDLRRRNHQFENLQNGPTIYSQPDENGDVYEDVEEFEE